MIDGDEGDDVVQLRLSSVMTILREAGARRTSVGEGDQNPAAAAGVDPVVVGGELLQWTSTTRPLTGPSPKIAR